MPERKILLQIQRINSVISELKNNLHLVGALPYLFSTEGVNILDGYFDVDELRKIRDLYNNFDIRFLYFFLENKTFRHLELSSFNTNERIRQLINLLVDNEALRGYLGKTGEDMKKDSKDFRELYKANLSYCKFIKEFSGELSSLRIYYSKILKEQIEKKQGYSLKLERLKKSFQCQIQNFLYSCDQKMVEEQKKSEDFIVDLKKDAELCGLRYNETVKKHIEREREIRKERIKTEEHLKSIIKKFDEYIGEKDKIYQALKLEYKKQCEVHDKIQKDLEDQEDVYNKVMAEKKEEEDRIQEELVYQFFLNRAARKIQLFWREFVKNRALKKKKKGKLKKSP